MNNFNLFFATGTKQYLEFLLISGIKNILISFAYPEPWKMKNIIKRNGVNLLCDSGAFTSWNLAYSRRRMDSYEYALEEYAGEEKKKEINSKVDNSQRKIDLSNFFNNLTQEQKEKCFEEADRQGKWKKHLINIDEYLEHLNKYKGYIWRAVNLDIIPGVQGIKPTQDEIIQAAEQGWQNYLYLKKNGWNTVHVFHQHEPLWVLDRMLKECDYIGISPCNDSSEQAKYIWMDTIFRYILESDNPKIKTHGFAVTSKTLMERYPWYSCDSSSYSLTAAMGSIFTPYGRVYVSDENKHRSEHINNKPQEIQKHINDYLEKEIGYGLLSMTEKSETMEAKCPKCHYSLLTNSKIMAYKARNFANISYLYSLEQKIQQDGPTLDFMKQQKLF